MTRMRYRPSGTAHGPSLGYAGYQPGWRRRLVLWLFHPGRWRRFVTWFRAKFYARSDHLPPY